MKTIFFGWIHGVGKSSIIQGIMKEKENIGHYSFWENVRKLAKKSGKIHDIKELSWLSNEVRLELLQEAKKKFRDIVTSELYDILLVDNHFSVYENKQLVKALDDEDIALYDTFILVNVPADILHTRISQDNKQRTRESCDKEKMVHHSIYERKIAEEIKKKWNIDLIEVENIDLHESIKEVQKRIEK